MRCKCKVCRSTDPRDKRLRCSALVEIDGKNLLIDCGPDFREQMLRYHSGDLDALLVTHHHYDHVGGMDDLRPYIKGKVAFDVYCQRDVADDMKRRMPYCFQEPAYPGVPHYRIHEIHPLERTEVAGIEVEPLPVNHYLLEIVGFRIGNLGYITDAKRVPDVTVEHLRGVDTLVINALRHEPHPSHMTLEESLEIIRRVKPRMAYLTHLSHDMGLTSELEAILPEGVTAAQDGIVVEIPD